MEQKGIKILQVVDHSKFHHIVKIEDEWSHSLSGINIDQLFEDFAKLDEKFTFDLVKHVGNDSVTYLEFPQSPFREIIVDILEAILFHCHKTFKDISEMKILSNREENKGVVRELCFLVVRFTDKQLTFIPFDLKKS